MLLYERVMDSLPEAMHSLNGLILLPETDRKWPMVCAFLYILTVKNTTSTKKKQSWKNAHYICTFQSYIKQNSLGKEQRYYKIGIWKCNSFFNKCYCRFHFLNHTDSLWKDTPKCVLQIFNESCYRFFMKDVTDSWTKCNFVLINSCNAILGSMVLFIYVDAYVSVNNFSVIFGRFPVFWFSGHLCHVTKIICKMNIYPPPRLRLNLIFIGHIKATPLDTTAFHCRSWFWCCLLLPCA